MLSTMSICENLSISSQNIFNVSDMSIINYKNVDIHIDSKIILENVSFTLDAGEFAYLVGAVGSGKSSLIKTMYGEVDIYDGNATLFDEYNMRKIKRSKLQALRRRIGVVFQDFQLLTDRSVYENLDFVLRSTGWKSKREREKRIGEVLELVELPQKGYKMPHELSGGEQQRIVIARAILNRPELILADEPTGNLDNETGRKIMSLLHRICREDGTAVIMITHNEHWLELFPGREFRCKGGKLTVLDKSSQPAVNDSVNETVNTIEIAVVVNEQNTACEVETEKTEEENIAGIQQTECNNILNKDCSNSTCSIDTLDEEEQTVDC